MNTKTLIIVSFILSSWIFGIGFWIYPKTSERVYIFDKIGKYQKAVQVLEEKKRHHILSKKENDTLKKLYQKTTFLK
ncbi:MAG: hypothetical protein ACI86H_002331 [bacterium]|jgi:hypothetical protein